MVSASGAQVLDNVLQKYGFQPGPLGVFNMLNSLQQFSSDQEVVSKATEIREKCVHSYSHILDDAEHCCYTRIS